MKLTQDKMEIMTIEAMCIFWKADRVCVVKCYIHKILEIEKFFKISKAGAKPDCLWRLLPEKLSMCLHSGWIPNNLKWWHLRRSFESPYTRGYDIQAERFLVTSSQSLCLNPCRKSTFLHFFQVYQLSQILQLTFPSKAIYWIGIQGPRTSSSFKD